MLILLHQNRSFFSLSLNINWTIIFGSKSNQSYPRFIIHSCVCVWMDGEAYNSLTMISFSQACLPLDTSLNSHWVSTQNLHPRHSRTAPPLSNRLTAPASLLPRPIMTLLGRLLFFPPRVKKIFVIALVVLITTKAVIKQWRLPNDCQLKTHGVLWIAKLRPQAKSVWQAARSSPGGACSHEQAFGCLDGLSFSLAFKGGLVRARCAILLAFRRVLDDFIQNFYYLAFYLRVCQLRSLRLFEAHFSFYSGGPQAFELPCLATWGQPYHFSAFGQPLDGRDHRCAWITALAPTRSYYFACHRIQTSCSTPRHYLLCQHPDWPMKALSVCQRRYVRSDQSDWRLVFKLGAFWETTGLQLLHWAPFDCQGDYLVADSFSLFSPASACFVWAVSHRLDRTWSREAKRQGCQSRQPFS